MNSDELGKEIDALLRGLRSCDTQATAVAWMARAYKAMEQSLEHIRQPEQPRFVFVPERPKLEIVQTVPKPENWPKDYLLYRSTPAPKAWTHKDTVNLERVARDRVNTQKLKRWAERKGN